jgi:DNA-binding transcriptional regulator YiaG
MSNVAQALKDEIIRISHKEIKASVNPIHKSSVNLKKTVADLKKKIGFLESENKRLLKSAKIADEQVNNVSPEVAEKVRITSKSIYKLRTKLGLTQPSFAKLLGVSSQNVFALEHKEGRLRLRPKTLSNLLSIRDLGKREVKKRLEEINGK